MAQSVRQRTLSTASTGYLETPSYVRWRTEASAQTFNTVTTLHNLNIFILYRAPNFARQAEEIERVKFRYQR